MPSLEDFQQIHKTKHKIAVIVFYSTPSPDDKNFVGSQISSSNPLQVTQDGMEFQCRQSLACWLQISALVRIWMSSPAQLDPYPCLVGWGNNELEIYTEDNALVSGGVLSITASYNGTSFQSAKLRTWGLKEFTPLSPDTPNGIRIEASIQLPQGHCLLSDASHRACLLFILDQANVLLLQPY